MTVNGGVSSDVLSNGANGSNGADGTDGEDGADRSDGSDRSDVIVGAGEDN